MNTSLQSETELSSVNSILMAIGQAPINRIYKNTKQEPGPVQQIRIDNLNNPLPVQNSGQTFTNQAVTSAGSTGQGLRIKVVFNDNNELVDYQIQSPGVGYLARQTLTFVNPLLVDYQVVITETSTPDLVYINPEVSFVHSLLMEVNADVQNEGWVFNRENHYPLTPESDGCIYVPENILRMDVYENAVYRTTDLVKRNGNLYDKMNHTFEFDPQAIYFDMVWKWEYEELPSVFKRYITLRASGRAATQLVTNPAGTTSSYTRSTSSCSLYGIRM